MRIIDELLCAYVAEEARGLQRVIKSNAVSIEKWGRSAQAGAAAGPMKPPAIPPADAAGFWAAAVKMGNALVCRQLLAGAVYDASCAHVPFLVGGMNGAERHGNGKKGLRLPEGLHAAENVGHACGIVGRDPPLWGALQLLAADHAWASLLPVAFSSMFATDVWKDAEYLPEFGGFKANHHVVAYAIDALFSQMEHGVVPRDTPEKFVALSASVLLRMEVFDGMQPGGEAALLFLGKYAGIAGISRGVLEAHLPCVVMEKGGL